MIDLVAAEARALRLQSEEARHACIVTSGITLRRCAAVEHRSLLPDTPLDYVIVSWRRACTELGVERTVAVELKRIHSEAGRFSLLHQLRWMALRTAALQSLHCDVELD